MLKPISDTEMAGLEQQMRAIWVARPAQALEGHSYLTPYNVLATIQRCHEAEKALQLLKEQLQGWLANRVA